jgi:small conductance mechanosensitive channel
MDVLSEGGLSSLPKYLDEHRRVFIEIPIRIVVIIVVALIIRALLHRAINRLVKPVREGGVPRILRPLRDSHKASAVTSAVLGSTGLLSERRAQRAATVGSVLKSAVSFIVFLIAFMLILSEVDINLAPFIAGTSIVGVALAFGAQNIVKDFLSGMFMIFEDQYGVGDVIDFEKATGTVEAVGLRSTRLRDVNGTVWYVRNGEVVRVGNKSQGFAQVVLDVPITAETEVARASAAILQVAREMQAEEEWNHLFLSDPEVQGVEAITLEETTIRMVVRVRPLEQWRVARELRLRIRERLDRLGVDAGPPSEPENPPPATPPPPPPADPTPAPAEN